MFQLVLCFSFITIAPIYFSEPYSGLWKHLFGDFGVQVMQSSEALRFAFAADIFAVFVLSWWTGGAASPFVPVFFVLPALAIFLRESFGRVIFYVILIAVLFTAGTFRESSLEQRGASGRLLFAYWFVSIACFALATAVGYITRPR